MKFIVLVVVFCGLTINLPNCHSFKHFIQHNIHNPFNEIKGHHLQQLAEDAFGNGKHMDKSRKHSIYNPSKHQALEDPSIKTTIGPSVSPTSTSKLISSLAPVTNEFPSTTTSVTRKAPEVTSQLSTEVPATTTPGTTESPATTTPGSTEAPATTTPGTTEAPATTTPGSTEAPATTTPVTSKVPEVTSQLSTKAPAPTTPGSTEAPATTTLVTTKDPEITTEVPVTTTLVVTTMAPETTALETSKAPDSTVAPVETPNTSEATKILESTPYPVVFADFNYHRVDAAPIPIINPVLEANCNGKDFICETKSSYLICSEDALGVFRATVKQVQECSAGFACDNNAATECAIELSPTTVQQGDTIVSPIETTTIQGGLAASETTKKASKRRKKKSKSIKVTTSLIVSTTVRTEEINTTVI